VVNVKGGNKVNDVCMLFRDRIVRLRNLVGMQTRTWHALIFAIRGSVRELVLVRDRIISTWRDPELP